MTHVLTSSVHGKLVIQRRDMNAGDTVSMHDHSFRPTSKHITIVLKGSISITFAPSGSERLVPAGELIDYDEDQQKHMITALEDGTVILNIPLEAYIP